MSQILGVIVFFLSVLVWHETAHMAAAKYYGCYEKFVLFRHPDRLLQFAFFGIAVGVDDEPITKMQLWSIYLAPLLYLPFAVALGAMSYVHEIPLLFYPAAVFGFAGAAVFLSDIPMMVMDRNEETDYKTLVLHEVAR